MNVCGIVCEYNPFHSGHLYQLQQTKWVLGQDTAVVCLMSGNFVQRGDLALYHKELRAKWAVEQGASLVLELPIPFALSGAEGFARGAVEILHRMSLVTHLSFGGECGDINELRQVAETLLEKEIIDNTITNMESGISYAAAREQALFAKLKDRADLIKSPNNILGVEYIKALLTMESHIKPVVIQRTGVHHDSCQMKGGFASASHLRQCIKGGYSVMEYLPSNVAETIKAATTHKLEENNNAVMARLLSLKPHDFLQLPDVSEGLEHRLYRAVQQSFSIEDACTAAKSKRYAHSRVRRIFFRGFLGLTRERQLYSPYVRVLAFNSVGQKLLSDLRKTSNIPLITKPAHIQKLGKYATDLFECEQLAARLYHMFATKPYDFVPEHKKGPMIIP